MIDDAGDLKQPNPVLLESAAAASSSDLLIHHSSNIKNNKNNKTFNSADSNQLSISISKTGGNSIDLFPPPPPFDA